MGDRSGSLGTIPLVVVSFAVVVAVAVATGGAYSNGWNPPGAAPHDSLLASALIGSADDGAFPMSSPQTVIATIPVGPSPSPAVYDPRNGDLYATTHLYGGGAFPAGNLVVVAGSSNSLIGSIPMGVSLSMPVYEDATGTLYVADETFGIFHMISSSNDSIVGSFRVSSGAFAQPAGLTVDPRDGDLYIPYIQNGAGYLSVVSGTTYAILETLPMGYDPGTPTFVGATGDLYVPYINGTAAGFLAVVAGSNNTLIATIPVDSFPISPTYDPSNGDLYVACGNDNDMDVVNTTTDRVAATIPIGTDPTPPVYDAANGRIYELASAAGYLLVVSDSSNTIVSNVSVGAGSAPPTVDNLNGNVYVASNGAGNGANVVREVSGTNSSVLATIPLSSTPTGEVTVDYANGYLYVPTSGGALLALGPTPASRSTFLGLPGSEGYALVGSIIGAAGISAGIGIAVFGRSSRPTPEPARRAFPPTGSSPPRL